MSEPQLGPVVTSSEPKGNAVYYSSVTLQGHEYHIDDCAYFSPDSFTFSVKLPTAAKKSKQDQADTKLVLSIFGRMLQLHCHSMLSFFLSVCLSVCCRSFKFIVHKMAAARIMQVG